MDTDGAKQLANFGSWFLGLGGYLHPSVEFFYSEAGGVHLRAKFGVHDSASPVTKGTLVISCPHVASLSALNAKDVPPLFPSRSGGKDGAQPEGTVIGEDGRDDDYVFTRKLLEGTRPQCIAALYLSAQWRLGKQSWWFPYLDILPALPSKNHVVDRVKEKDHGVKGLGEVDSPLWWDLEDLVWIRGTNLDKGRIDLEDLWRQEWAKLEECTSVRNSGINWTLFKWAMTMLGSRAFSSRQIISVLASATSNTPILSIYNPDMLLYPGLDSLNHNPLSQNRWVADENGFGIVCEDRLHPGEEIWNPYGGKGNSELLLSYGFSLESNPCDTFALKLPGEPHPALRLFSNSPEGGAEAEGMPAAGNRPQQAQQPMTPHNAPPALSLPHNTFYIRPSSRFALSEPEYFSITSLRVYSPSNVALIQPFLGFPSILLSSLALMLFKRREQALITAEPRQINVRSVWMQLGGRVQFAIIDLLISKLGIEVKRFSKLIETMHNWPARRFDSEMQGHHQVDIQRRKQRMTFTRFYLAGQYNILNDNMGVLDDFVHSAIEQRLLLTPVGAIQCLRSMDKKVIYSQFKTGFSAVTGTFVPEVLIEGMWTLEFFTLWIGSIISLVMSRSQLGFDGMEDEVPAWLRKWILSRIDRHGLDLSIDNEVDMDDDEEKADEEEADKHHLDNIDWFLSSIRQNVQGPMTIWDEKRWPTNLIRFCIKVVQEDIFDFLVLKHGHGNSNWHGDEWKAKRDETPVLFMGE